MNRYLLAAVVLTLLTWWAGDADFRAHPVVGSMNLPAFPGSASHWQVHGPADNVRFGDDSIELQLNDPRATLVNRFLVVHPPATDAGPHLRVSGHIRRLSKTAFERDRSLQTRFLIIYRKGEELLQYGAVTRVNGGFARQRFEYLVRPPAGTDRIELRWNQRVPGHWSLHDLKVSAVEVNPHYRAVAVGLALLWFGFFIGISRALLIELSPPHFVAVLACVGVLILGTGMGQDTVSALMDPVMVFAGSVLPVGFLPGAQSLLKAGHVLVFLLLTVLLLAARRVLGLHYWQSLLLCITFAVASEALQRHRFNRSPELRDVLIDGIGIVLGTVLVGLWYRYRPHRSDARASTSDSSHSGIA